MFCCLVGCWDLCVFRLTFGFGFGVFALVGCFWHFVWVGFWVGGFSGGFVVLAV